MLKHLPIFIPYLINFSSAINVQLKEANTSSLGKLRHFQEKIQY